MPGLWTSFWNDDRGFIVTAEAALLVTMAAVGVTVGVHSAAKSVDAELRQVSRAFRSLDQSYVHYGFAKRGAATAGSGYQQEPVEDSLAELKRYEDRLERERRKVD
jgi:hypothetical protein